MESRGIDVDTWERKHVAGHFDLPAKVFKIARVYRPPVAAWEKPDQLRLGGLFLAQGTCAALHNSRPSRLAARTHHGRATSRQGPHPSAPLVPA
jgi:hypothetical protein